MEHDDGHSPWDDDPDFTDEVKHRIVSGAPAVAGDFEALEAAGGELFPRERLDELDVPVTLVIGECSRSLCSASPGLTTTCYDLPHGVPLTQAEIDQAGMTERIATVAGDFFADEELPGGHDVLLLDAGFREVTRVPCSSPGANGVLVARA